MKSIFNDFVNQKFVIPFGRVIQGGVLKSPYNETMVGRKQQRKYLIRWLLEPKKNGCMLVTGTRGSGKTSFVNHCVAEHNLNSHSRIIQNNITFKIGDYLFFIVIFCSLAFILDSSLIFLFIESDDSITKKLLGLMGVFPSLVVLLYNMMLWRALKVIKKQYYKSVKGENDEYSRQIKSLGFGLKMKSFLFILISSYVILSGVCYFFAKDSKQWIIFNGNDLSSIIIFVIILNILWWFIIFITKYRSWRSLFFSLTFIVIVIGIGIGIDIGTVIYKFFHLLISTNYFKYFDNSLVLFLVLYMLLGYYFENKLIKKILKENQDSDPFKQKKRYAIYLSQWSFPEIILRHYVPSIFIPINLGFKDLRHSNIIHAMLTELRDKYREIFLGGNYAFNKIIPVILMFLSLILWQPLSEPISHIGESISHEIKISNHELNIPNVTVPIIKNQDIFLSHSKSSLNQFLNKTALKGTIGKERKLITILLNEDKNVDQDTNKFYFKYTVVDMLGMLTIFFTLYLAILFRPLSYQRRNIAKIDKLLRDFSSSVTRTQKGVIGSLHKISNTILGNNEKSTQSAPINSRIAEIRMIKLLEDISKDQQGWFLSHGKIFTLASPSVIFVFDELDKLHNHGGFVEDVEIHDKQKSYTENEAARTNQINILLSDMKNFITTAKAKFIFVAGRDLHDQWLADANAREAFLTSIFDIELFIPSLLTDTDRVLTDIKTNIIEYVNLQYVRARLYDKKQKISYEVQDKLPYEVQDKLMDNNLLSNKDQSQLAETFSLMNEDCENSKFRTLYDNLELFQGRKDLKANDTIYTQCDENKDVTTYIQ